MCVFKEKIEVFGDFGVIFIGGFWLDIQREEKNVQKAIKEAAKRNDMGSAKVLFFTIFILSVVNFYL